MKISGIITEYNPYHNGHLYHLKKTKEITGAKAVICVLNGNFMQRGTPAITNKWTRTRMALNCGVDLVLELPLIYGIRSAEYFATGALTLLEKTGVVDSFVFGSESGELKPLSFAADILSKEPKYFQKRLQHYLNQGQSFPGARQKALLDTVKKQNTQISTQKINQAVQKPNNILGIEYLKALKNHNLSLKPITIKRIGSDYHEKNIKGEISSATSIRKIIYEKNNISIIKNLLPKKCYELLNRDMKKGLIPIKKEKLGTMILTKLRTISKKELKKFAELKNGLDNRIYKFALKCGNFKELIEKIQTRSFTNTRIQRNLLHILFDIREKDFNTLDEYGPLYLRVLGFNNTGKKLLSKIKNKSSLPIITCPTDYLKNIKTRDPDPLIKQISYDILATDIYSLLYKKSKKRKARGDFYHQIITPENLL